jgi:hypothetical protein
VDLNWSQESGWNTSALLLPVFETFFNYLEVEVEWINSTLITGMYVSNA